MPALEPRPIRRLLVANRGEIPRRVFVTARDMGIDTVAVFSDPDAELPFVNDADVAVPLHGRTPSETYLDVQKILDAARRSGADAVHPGYGFLAETAAAAQAVVDAGLVWVGPRPDQIALMASKVAAKRCASDAGVPMPPSAELVTDDVDDWLDAATKVGFPLLVKASAGGGGKGMRLVSSVDEVADAVGAARREAMSAFGDPEVFLERYLSPVRHVEVQVLGDVHGTVVHLGERECSIQRRHQKVIEEAPSPGITEAVRQDVCRAAVDLASSIGYVGAGTVEFVVSGDGDGQEFFFLEMNTRLQVEHSVTELTRAVDLVREQLLVAMGRPLDVERLTGPAVGHAIEARVYAEDPAAGHLPSTGSLDLVDPGDGPRWDLAVWTGSVVTPFYDPMLAKATVFGDTREQATDRLVHALRRTRVHGVTTNVASLVAVLDSADFRSGRTTTDFLDMHAELLTPTAPDAVRRAHVAAAALWAMADERRLATALAFAPTGWRNVPAVPQVRTFVEGAGEEVAVTYDGAGVADLGAALVSADEHGALVDVDGLRHSCRVSAYGDVDERTVHVHSDGWHTVLREVPRFASASVDETASGPSAPVPGTVTAVLVHVGDRVEAGSPLVLLEAMKMEHRVTSDVDAVVAVVRVEVGDSVDAHQVLVELES